MMYAHTFIANSIHINLTSYRTVTLALHAAIHFNQEWHGKRLCNTTPFNTCAPQHELGEFQFHQGETNQSKHCHISVNVKVSTKH